MLRRLLRLEVSRSYLSWFSITCLGFSLSSLNLHIICWPRPSSPAVFSALHECLIASGHIETADWNPVQSAFSTQCLAFQVSMTLSAPISCSLYSEGAMGTEELLRITLAFFFLFTTLPHNFTYNFRLTIVKTFFSSSIMCLFFEGVVSNMG